MPDIVPINANNGIVDSLGKITQTFRTWTNAVTRESVIVGEGSPEGIISASLHREYVDANGVTGTIKYIKMSSEIGGDTKKGWVLM
ncbi:hypothetical protein KAR91_84165 [Candidatus Pacearchaeota archaeon]|nr:hypothetical protein [Candidatus Pacearchaeota archaeon]